MALFDVTDRRGRVAQRVPRVDDRGELAGFDELRRYVDATIGCLRAAGFSWALTDHAWNAIDSFVYGFTLQKLNFPFQPDEYAKMAKAFLPMIPPPRIPT
jgi:hypothetical protein